VTGLRFSGARPRSGPVRWRVLRLVATSGFVVLRLVLLGAGAVAQEGPAQAERQRPGLVGLHVGEGRMLRLDHAAANVMLGDTSVADIQVVTPTSLYVYGRKPGQTTLTATDSASGLSAQLVLRVDRSGAAAAASLLPDRSVSVGFEGNRMVVRGAVRDLGQALDTESAAHSFSPSTQPPLDRTRLAGAQQVTLRVRIAEVSRTDLRQLGINLNILANPGSFAFGLMTGSFVGTTAAAGTTMALSALSTATNSFGNASIGVTSSRITGEALVSALQSEGLLTMLAEPNLMAISGETASFLAGGEVPIPVPQALGVTTIQYKQYGVQLNFTPTLLPANRIAMRVSPEVSELSTANAVSIAGVTVPAFIDRRADTSVEMASGETLAIAGLFQRNVQNNISKFPFLADVPVLGALFRSVSYQKAETELIILVTPYLTQPVTAQNAFPLPTEPPAYARLPGARPAGPQNGGFVVN